MEDKNINTKLYIPSNVKTRFEFIRGFGINELIANALAWVFAVLFSYITNKRWVFRVSTPTKTAALVQMFAFFSGRFFTLIIEETIIFVFITMLSYPSMWVKLAAQVVVVVLNYIISKLFVFKNQ